MNLLHQTPKNAMIIIEDVDVLFQNRKNRFESRITFSGFLNALNGIASQDGRMIFMTTNYRDNLDPALLRPGRADRHFKLDYSSKNQLEKYFLNFYNEGSEYLKDFLDKVPENRISIAELQGFFLNYKNDPKEAVKNINILIDYVIKREEIEEKNKAKCEEKNDKNKSENESESEK